MLSISYNQCLIDAQMVVDTLVSLGFMIKAKKSVTIPSQTFFYLGYLWDTLTMTCSLPSEKLDNIKFVIFPSIPSDGKDCWITVEANAAQVGREDNTSRNIWTICSIYIFRPISE